MIVKCISNRDGTPQFQNLTVRKVYKAKESYSYFKNIILVKDDGGKYVEYSKSLFVEV